MPPTQEHRSPDGGLEQLFWERRFDEGSFDDVVDVSAFTDETNAPWDVSADWPVIRWRASPLDRDASEPPPICWHASR